MTECTSEKYERLADEAEAGFPAERVGASRPGPGHSRGRSETVIARISPVDKARLVHLMDDEGKNQSDLVREALLLLFRTRGLLEGSSGDDVVDVVPELVRQVEELRETLRSLSLAT